MVLRPGWSKCGTSKDQVVEERGLQEKALMAVFLLNTTVIVDTLNGKKARYEFLDALLA